MQSRLRMAVFVAAVVIVALAILFLWVRNEYRIDQCLDHGGRWNYESQQCEGARTS
jgi:hypothetical protein